MAQSENGNPPSTDYLASPVGIMASSTPINNVEGSSSNGGRLRSTLSVRPKFESSHPEFDAISEGSELMNESVVSSITDRYGFLAAGAEQSLSNKDHEQSKETEIELLRRRESKWLEMINNWDSYMMKNYKKVRERCRKGIPASVRPRAWLHLCGAQYQLANPEKEAEFQRLHTQQGDQRWIDDIEKDLHRNFPTHEMFGGTYERIGQKELFRVLKAYSVFNPVDGYCQAMAPLAALLLMNMPAEHAFWCLAAICDRYIPGYYSPGMEAIQLDGDILYGLLKKVSPSIHKHLSKQGVEPILYMTEWFLCVFARTLPWPSVMRIWDMFMCEGVKVLFRVALVLIKFSLPRSVRKKCPSMYETLDVLKNIPERIMQEEFLVQEVLKLDITEEDMEKEHRKQLKRRREKEAQKAREREQRNASR